MAINWLQQLVDPTYGTNFMGWKKDKLNVPNSPVPASQLPFRPQKEVFVPEVIKETAQDSRPVPSTLNKGITPEERVEGIKKAQADKQANIKAKTAFNNKGMKKEVMKLQQDLVDAGFGKLLGNVDGKWGAKSIAALEAFQQHQIAERANTYELKSKTGQLPSNNLKTQLASKFKKGGTIENTKENIAIPNLPKKKEGSKIYIKPENKGKFTATKKETGKSTEELTHSKNPVTKKRAIFAQNAAKWKHEEGGKVKNSPVPTSQLSYKTPSVKEVTSGRVPIEKRIQNSKTAPEALLKDKLKAKYTAKKQRGGTVGEGPKEGDTAAVYKKGSKVGKKQVGGAMGSGAAAYGAAKKGAKLPEKKGKIDASKWKK